MPKQRTQGATIQFRLPLEIMVRVEQDAEQAQVSVGQWMKTIALAHYRQPKAPPTSNARPKPTTGVCHHTHTRALSGGMKVCEACDQIRGLDGQWRARQ